MKSELIDIICHGNCEPLRLNLESAIKGSDEPATHKSRDLGTQRAEKADTSMCLTRSRDFVNRASRR